jgi:hypothetical protein
MQYRDHRGGLAESLVTVVHLEPTLAALSRHLRVEADQLEVIPYGYDERINWDTHIVKQKNGPVFGMTDGPIHDSIESDGVN